MVRVFHFSLGLINSISKKFNYNLTKKEIADIALYVERVLYNEEGGIQDQIASSFGGFNLIKFYKNDIINQNINTNIKYTAYNYDVFKLNISNDILNKLNNNLFLYFTGIVRNSFDIQKDTQKNIINNINNIKKISDIVNKAVNCLQNDELDSFGILLNEAWLLKKELNDRISSNYIDNIYIKGLQYGALGGKILGAGGGGFILFYVPIKNQTMFKHEMNKELMNIPFNFENNGSQILYLNND